MSASDKVTYDTAIVGAGAAGLMASIVCGRAGLKTLLLDSKVHFGAKILMSGGTRCNVTNREVTERDFESEKIRTVRDVLRAFSAEEAIAFFKELGVELVLEPGGKYFPRTHRAETVLKALVGEAKKTGVTLLAGARVGDVSEEKGLFRISGNGFTHHAKTVLISTGGLSHPNTGSDGAGYAMAKKFGHSMVSTSPALTPFTTDDPDWKKLSGIALPCGLTLFSEGKKGASFRDSFLFTHFGFSGPAALNMSRYWVRVRDQKNVTIQTSFLPETTEESFRKELSDAALTHPKKMLSNYLMSFFPERLVEVLLKKAGVSASVILNQLTQNDRARLLETLFRYPLPVAGVVGYGKAEVTAGGIHLSEVNGQTLESKLKPGLFFAGEVLDVDGRIGGFNFQWAWSSAVVASRGIAKKVKEA